MATPPVFTSGQILTAAQMNAVGMWLVKSQTIGSAVPSVTVSDAFTSDFDNYKIVISGGVASTTNTLNMTLGSTVTGYGRIQALYAYNSSSVSVDNDNFTSAFMVVGGGSVNGLSATMDVLQPYAATATSVYSSLQQLVASTANNVRQTYGAILNTTSYTAFTLTASSGTITGGKISVYGYR
jgi:hypothetical protein